MGDQYSRPDRPIGGSLLAGRRGGRALLFVSCPCSPDLALAPGSDNKMALGFICGHTSTYPYKELHRKLSSIFRWIYKEIESSFQGLTDNR